MGKINCCLGHLDSTGHYVKKWTKLFKKLPIKLAKKKYSCHKCLDLNSIFKNNLHVLNSQRSKFCCMVFGSYLLPGPSSLNESLQHRISTQPEQDSKVWPAFFCRTYSIQMPKQIPCQILTQCVLLFKLLAPLQHSRSLPWFSALQIQAFEEFGFQILK